MSQNGNTLILSHTMTSRRIDSIVCVYIIVLTSAALFSSSVPYKVHAVGHSPHIVDKP